MTAIGFRIIDPIKNYKGADVQMYATEMVEPEAKLACSLIERWGLVAAEVDGEDSAGRAKFRRLSPSELVGQACDSAAIAFDEFRRRGWTQTLPTPDEAEAILKERGELK